MSVATDSGTRKSNYASSSTRGSTVTVVEVEHNCPLPEATLADGLSKVVFRWTCPECGQPWRSQVTRVGSGSLQTSSYRNGHPDEGWKYARAHAFEQQFAE